MERVQTSGTLIPRLLTPWKLIVMPGHSEPVRQTRDARQASNRRVQILDIVHVASSTGPQRFAQHEGSTE